LQTALAMRLKICVLGKKCPQLLLKHLEKQILIRNVLRNRGMSLLRLLFFWATDVNAVVLGGR
jgi:hypothetical protein